MPIKKISAVAVATDVADVFKGGNNGVVHK